MPSIQKGVLMNSLHLALATSALLAGSAAAATAQDGVVHRRIKAGDFLPNRDNWGAITDTLELEGAKELKQWTAPPKAVVTTNWKSQFVVIDFTLTEGPTELRDEDSVLRYDEESLAESHKIRVKAITAVSLMFRIPGQEAKSATTLRALGNPGLEGVAPLLDPEIGAQYIEFLERQIAEAKPLGYCSDKLNAEFKRTLQQQVRLVKTVGAKLTKPQRAKLKTLLLEIDKAPEWRAHLPALQAFLRTHAAKGDRIGLGLHSGFRLTAVLEMMAALQEYALVIPFEQEGERIPFPKDPKKLREFFKEKKPTRTPSSVNYVPLPFTRVDAAAFAGTAGTALTVDWDPKAFEGTYALGGEAAEEEGLEALAELLEAADPEALRTVKCDLPPHMRSGDFFLLLASLRLAGTTTVVVKQP
jgi:hypothetical protein